jgi:hypothetical protein
MNKGRLTSLVRLSYLGPEIVRALLAGSQSNALTPSRLLRLSKNLPHDWKEQRCFLGFAAFETSQLIRCRRRSNFPQKAS